MAFAISLWGPSMDDVFPLVYDELRRIAAVKLRGERTSHTLSATAVVHEAWLELRKLNRIQSASAASTRSRIRRPLRRSMVRTALSA